MTLSISGIHKSDGRHSLSWIAAAAFCLVFSSVYNLYGHGVHSFFMSFLFLWPLTGAAWYLLLPSLAGLHPGRFTVNAINAGIATLAAGSLLRGILEIAGTSSPYEPFFFWVGGAVCLLGIFHLFRYHN